MKLYLVGSLRNPRIPEIGERLRGEGHQVFDDWFSAGPHADDAWRDYEKSRGHNMIGALNGLAASHVFNFDLYHLNECDGIVMVCPAGKSCHLEFGFVVGQGKPGFILIDEDPDRYDVMYLFATEVVSSVEDLFCAIEEVGFTHIDISAPGRRRPPEGE